MNVLIVGDSFASKYNGKYPGWANLLEQDYKVTNLAQPGISEYKILKQVESIAIDQFDRCIISHTSPYRIHTAYHPLHTEGFHKHSDFIYADVKDRLPDVERFFTEYFDLDYAVCIHELLKKQIACLLQHIHTIDTESLGLQELFSQQPGEVQHLSEDANLKFYNQLRELL